MYRPSELEPQRALTECSQFQLSCYTLFCLFCLLHYVHNFRGCDILEGYGRAIDTFLGEYDIFNTEEDVIACVKRAPAASMHGMHNFVIIIIIIIIISTGFRLAFLSRMVVLESGA